MDVEWVRFHDYGDLRDKVPTVPEVAPAVRLITKAQRSRTISGS